MSNQSRESAEQFVKRLQNDPAFKQQVDADPVAAFEAEGFSPDAIHDFMREGLITPDVAGYNYCPICNWTCLVTN